MLTFDSRSSGFKQIPRWNRRIEAKVRFEFEIAGLMPFLATTEGCTYINRGSESEQPVEIG